MQSVESLNSNNEIGTKLSSEFRNNLLAQLSFWLFLKGVGTVIFMIWVCIKTSFKNPRGVLYCQFLISRWSWTHLPFFKILCSMAWPQVDLHPVSTSFSPALDQRKKNSVIACIGNKWRRISWLRALMNGSRMTSNSRAYGISNQIFRLRVRKIELREEILVTRTENPRMSGRNRLA